MPGADQHAAIAGAKGEDVAGGDDVILALGAIDCDRDRSRAVSGGNTGGDAFAGFD